MACAMIPKPIAQSLGILHTPKQARSHGCQVVAALAFHIFADMLLLAADCRLANYRTRQCPHENYTFTVSYIHGFTCFVGSSSLASIRQALAKCKNLHQV
jgi:uncharacterized membrane protein YhhN